MDKWKLTIIQVFFGLFTVCVVLISSTTSYSFFYTFFPNIIPETMLSLQIRSNISGVIGTSLLDLASIIWLYSFLYHSETSSQRAYASIMSVVTFIGAAAASGTYLGLTAQGPLALDLATQNTISEIALYTVIAAIILNFGAASMHMSSSLQSKAAIRAADRRDRIQDNNKQQEEKLDQMVTDKVDEVLTELAPKLAKAKADKLAEDFIRREGLVAEDYLSGNVDDSDAGVPASTQPEPEIVEDDSEQLPIRPVRPTNGNQ